MIPTVKMLVKYANGGESTVDVKPLSQIAFERKFDIAIGSAFDGSPEFRLEHVYYMAWHASKTSQEFDDWLGTVAGIEMVVADRVDPTPPAPSDGS